MGESSLVASKKRRSITDYFTSKDKEATSSKSGGRSKSSDAVASSKKARDNPEDEKQYEVEKILNYVYCEVE
ncbi:Hypothetical protein FKW44_021661, partial [Caligus rogercresseyi]